MEALVRYGNVSWGIWLLYWGVVVLYFIWAVAANRREKRGEES